MRREIARAKSASYSILNYDHMNCNFGEIGDTISLIRHFYLTDDELLEARVSNVYNRESGKRNAYVDLQIEKQTIVIVEGTGVLNEHISSLLDLRIRVDFGSYQETIKRLCRREAEKIQGPRLAEAFVRERYDLIDGRYDQYLRSRDSKFFDVLLDTGKLTSIKIYTR
ncbi:hypothetical protein TM7_0283 [candidate division TM7 genomosp. GTL1]|nr:hypothetical protein TM7_0283 [candidate division TM7 genomosp. GTL1]